MSLEDATQSDLIDLLVLNFGSMTNAAAVLNVNRVTLWRWRHGEINLEGTARVAVLAVLKHPEDYQEVSQC